MGINQLASFGQPPQVRAITLQQNAGFVPSAQIIQAGNGNGGAALKISVLPGNAVLIPAGNYIIQPGPYLNIQYFDGVSQYWRNAGSNDSNPTLINSDGTNYRVVNSGGCPVGAVITNAGTTLGATYPVQMIANNGYWQGGQFTPASGALLPFQTVISAGSSTWNTFVGGAINQTITITAAGSGYTLAPIVVIVPPANQGNQPYIPATAIATISAGAVNAVSVIDQGAGYVGVPTVLVVNAPGDTTGTGCVLTAALTGAGQITAIVNATLGTTQTAVPTFSFSAGTSSAPASAAATAIMNFSITAAGGTAAAGAGYTTGYALVLESGLSTATATYKNPAIEKGIAVPQAPVIYDTNTTVRNTGWLISFGGSNIQLVPRLVGIGAGMTTAGGITTPTVGGVSDSFSILAV